MAVTSRKSIRKFKNRNDVFHRGIPLTVCPWKPKPASGHLPERLLSLLPIDDRKAISTASESRSKIGHTELQKTFRPITCAGLTEAKKHRIRPFVQDMSVDNRNRPCARQHQTDSKAEEIHIHIDRPLQSKKTHWQSRARGPLLTMP